jgi:hypothetical protein
MNCSHSLRRIKLTAADEPAIQELLAKFPFWKRAHAMRNLRLRKLNEMIKGEAAPTVSAKEFSSQVKTFFGLEAAR